MIIRKFKKEDSRKLSNLIRKNLLDINSKDYPKKVINSMYDHFTPINLIKNAKERDVFVAVENKNVIGTASLKGNIILTVFVNPKIHNKGTGSKLMDKVESLAKRRGYKKVKLPSSITSYEFYKKRGYKKTKIHYSEEFGKTIEMEKKL